MRYGAALEHPDDIAVIHARTVHGDRVGSMKYNTVIARTYDRGGVEREWPAECEECRQIAEARFAHFMGQFWAGTGVFATGLSTPSEPVEAPEEEWPAT